jgi:hypothetical protein
MVCEAGATYWPWGCYNWANTRSSLAPVFGPLCVNQVRVSLQDAVTSKIVSLVRWDDVTIYGSLKSGFYPPAPRQLQTVHEIFGNGIPSGYFGWVQDWIYQ